MEKKSYTAAEQTTVGIRPSKSKLFMLLAVLLITAASGLLLVLRFTTPPSVITDAPIPLLQVHIPQIDVTPAEPEPEEIPPQILERLASFHAENSDLVGWIRIPGTQVDYPVMRSPYSDWDFYLNRNFEGQADSHGTPYIWPHFESADASDLVFVFAHNMADGSRFADVAKYYRQSFFEAHPTIEFATLYEERSFDIAFAFYVHSRDYHEYYYDNVRGYEDRIEFPYAFLTAWENQEEFDQFIEKNRRFQLYDTGVEVNYGDRLVALWTCTSGGPSELRLIVIGVQR